MNLSWNLSGERVSFRSAGLIAFCAAVLLGGATFSFAQSASSGVISGLVTDQQGAVIAGAEIRMVEPSTSSVRTALTNSVGRYSVPDVAPGAYDVTVSKSGFATTRFSGQNVAVGQSLLLNVALQIGATSVTVEVSAAAGAELQTLNSTIGTTLSNESLQLLPNLGRDASTLSVLTGGRSRHRATWRERRPTRTASSWTAATIATTWPARIRLTRREMDIAGRLRRAEHPTGVIPTPIESIEEFKVGNQQSDRGFQRRRRQPSPNGDQAWNQPFHGALYEFYFGSNVGAANLWKNNHTLVNGQATPLPSTHRNRFGGALGGPLTPKFWGGKTYFFANYEGMRFPNTVLFERGMPTALMRLGVVQLPNSAAFYGLQSKSVSGDVTGDHLPARHVRRCSVRSRGSRRQSDHPKDLEHDAAAERYAIPAGSPLVVDGINSRRLSYQPLAAANFQLRSHPHRSRFRR